MCGVRSQPSSQLWRKGSNRGAQKELSWGPEKFLFFDLGAGSWMGSVHSQKIS